MVIPTSRTSEAGRIMIDYSRCNGCSLCVEVCPDFEFKIIKEKVVPSGSAVFGYIACGHCIVICPEGAIQIEGRYLSQADWFPIPDPIKNAFPLKLKYLFLTNTYEYF